MSILERLAQMTSSRRGSLMEGFVVSYLEDVRRSLARLAVGDLPSDVSFSDSLDRILSRDSAFSMIEAILADDRTLESVAECSYRHSNGFDKITLMSSDDPEFKLRLHVWWPKMSGGVSREYVHNHRWWFRSKVLRGNSYVEIFAEQDNGKLMHRHEYVPRDAVTEKYALKNVGMAKMASQFMFRLAPGSTYSMSPDAFHRVLWTGDEVSITMFVRWGSIRSTASVFSEAGIEDEGILSVPSFAGDQLRGKLWEIMTELAG